MAGFVRRWLQLVGGVVAGVAIAWLIAQWALHLRLLNVQTGSMQPTFRRHDALIMRRIGANRLRPGMVVAYKSPRNPNELVTHRIVQLLPERHGFQTKGDALSLPDPIVRDSLAVGQVVAVLPGLGGVLGWLQTWPGLVVCVYLPAMGIVISELHHFERLWITSSRFYRLSRT